MEWYYYAILVAVVYPIVAILAGNLYWYVFNRHMTVTSVSYADWNASWMTIFCQKRTTLLFNLLFFSLAGFDQRYGLGKESIIYKPRFLVEKIIYHTPLHGYNKGFYVFSHLWLLPIKLIKLIFVIIITLAIAVAIIVTSFVIFLIRCIEWLSKSDSQIAEIKDRAEAISKGRIDEVIAKANPKKFRAPEQANTSSPAKRLKEIAVEAANLEAERLEIEQELQAEEEAQASEAGARVYQLKASNGD